jgi:hypothetical protein
MSILKKIYSILAFVKNGFENIVYTFNLKSKDKELDFKKYWTAERQEKALHNDISLMPFHHKYLIHNHLSEMLEYDLIIDYGGGTGALSRYLSENTNAKVMCFDPAYKSVPSLLNALRKKLDGVNYYEDFNEILLQIKQSDSCKVLLFSNIVFSHLNPIELTNLLIKISDIDLLFSSNSFLNHRNSLFVKSIAREKGRLWLRNYWSFLYGKRDIKYHYEIRDQIINKCATIHFSRSKCNTLNE